jgi:CRISPR-associated protein Cmr2
VEAARDLLLFTVPGVQRHIAESRTTGDLASASSQVAALVSVAVEAIGDDGEVVFPALGASDPAAGVPNRIVARVATGTGTEVARKAARDVHQTWSRWVAEVFPPNALPATPGFPDPQWVVVPAHGPDGRALTYPEQFGAGQRALAARRRVRSFAQVSTDGRELCTLAPRWAAEPSPPPRTPRHQAGERLSAVGWVKRRAPHSEQPARVPSTFSIATAPYRADVLARVHEREVTRALTALHRAAGALTSGEASVPGLAPAPGTPPALRSAARWLVEVAGPWVHPDRWTDQTVADHLNETVGPGGSSPDIDVPGARAAARELARSLGRTPGTHVAVISQDLDSLGRFVGDLAEVAGHADVSRRLRDLAAAQLAVMSSGGERRCLAVPVYAGGDDVLLLCPAATALDLADVMHGSVVEAFGGDGLTASTGVMITSSVSSLQGAVRGAQHLLEAAKGLPDKHGLAVGYERRSGASHRTVQPWVAADGRSTVARLGAVVRTGGVRLSPRLAFDLQRDRDELDRLGAAHPDLLHAEVRRRVRRHARAADGGRPADAEVDELARLVVDLGRREGGRESGFDPVPAAMVAVFLRQECR